MDGSRNIRPTEAKSEEPSNPIPILPSMPTDERSPDILPMAKILSGVSEGSLMKEGEVAIPQELGSLRLGILSADLGPEASLASQPVATGKDLADQSPVSISEPLILSRPMGRQSSPPFSPPLMKDIEYSHTPPDPGETAGSRSEELPAWIETMKSHALGDLNKTNKVRSQAPQGAFQIGKNLHAESEGKPFFRSDFPATEPIGLEERVEELKLNRAYPPFPAQNQEQEEASLFKKVFGKSSDHPASSLNPADQAFAGKEQKPADSLPEIRFPSGQMEWIQHQGTSFHSDSMGGGKAESGDSRIFVGSLEGSAASLNGLGNRIEGAQGLPPTVVRPEILSLPEHVVQRIIWSIRNQEERIKLTLDPPDLGHLYIEISRSKENIHATLWAENVAAKTALETRQHQIQRIMENEGFKLTKFDVFVQQDLGWFQGQGKRENHFALEPRTPGFSLEQKGKVLEKSPLDPIEMRRIAMARGGLDLWV